MQGKYGNIQYALKAFGINSHMTKEDVYNMAYVIRTELNISQHQPFDPFDLVDTYPDTLKLEYHSFDSDKIGGFLIKNDPFLYQSRITLNSNKTAESKKFNCCHELIHFFKHPEGGYSCSSSMRSGNFLEWQANEGAAELLIPYKKAIPYIAKQCQEALKIRNEYPIWGNFPFYYISALLSRKFNTSARIAEYRIANLEYEVCQYLNGVDIDNLNILSKKEQEAQCKHPRTILSYFHGKKNLSIRVHSKNMIEFASENTIHKQNLMEIKSEIS